MTAALTDDEATEMVGAIQEGIDELLSLIDGGRVGEDLSIDLLAHAILAPLPDRDARWTTLRDITDEISALRDEWHVTADGERADELNADIDDLYLRRMLLVDEAAGEVARLLTGRTTSSRITLSS